MDKILKITSRDKAKKGSIPVHYGAEPEQIANTDELITQVIPVRTVDAVKLKADLIPLVGTDADLTANGGSNSIIMTDTSANIRRVAQIISQLDKRDSTDNDIIVQQLKYADAAATAKLILDIFKPPTQPARSSKIIPSHFSVEAVVLGVDEEAQAVVSVAQAVDSVVVGVAEAQLPPMPAVPRATPVRSPHPPTHAPTPSSSPVPKTPWRSSVQKSSPRLTPTPRPIKPSSPIT